MTLSSPAATFDQSGKGLITWQNEIVTRLTSVENSLYKNPQNVTWQNEIDTRLTSVENSLYKKQQNVTYMNEREVQTKRNDITSGSVSGRMTLDEEKSKRIAEKWDKSKDTFAIIRSQKYCSSEFL